MKKFYLTLSAFIMLCCTITAQNAARECVLFEIFTGVNCPYCPAAANGIAQMLEEGLSIAPVAVHTSAFSTDAFYTQETNARANFYSINSYPTAKVDGILTHSGGGDASQSNYTAYLSRYQQRISVESPFTIDLSYEWLESSFCEVTAVVNKVGDCSATNLRVMIAFTESHIQKSWQGMSEVNFVVRDFLPDQNGTVFSGESMTVTEVLDMSGMLKENCDLVAWVQDFSTKEVYQTVKLSMRPETTPAYDVAFLSVDEVVTNNCSGVTPVRVSMKNSGTETINTLHFVVLGDNDDVIWEDDLECNIPAGESQAISLPEIDIMNNTTITICVTEVNGNDDACPFDNYSTKTISEAPEIDGYLKMQVKSPKEPEELYIEVKNMTTNELLTTYTFEEGSHAYTYELVLPEADNCYRISLISTTDNGIGGGMLLITDSNGHNLVQANAITNIFEHELSFDFTSNGTYTSVKENTVEVVSVFPNPVNDVMNIIGANVKNVTVYNSLGQMVFAVSGNSDNIAIDVKSWANGLYYVNITDVNGNNTSRKVLISK